MGNNKTVKKSGSKTGKIILMIIAACFLIFVLSVGSCIYKIVRNPGNIEAIKTMSATDAEIVEYGMFLDMNIQEKEREMEKYQNVIPEGYMQNIEVDDYETAGEKYNELYVSIDVANATEEEKQLAQAYKAYGEYYKALSVKRDFETLLQVPKISKMLVKAMMDNDEEYQPSKNNEENHLNE